MRQLWVVLLAAAACGGPATTETESAGDDLTSGTNAQIVVYSESGWTELADAIAKAPTPGASYYMHIAAPSTEKTFPRGPGDAAQMRAHGPRFHAMAEFQWAEWSAQPGTWYSKGVLFRARMAAAGYDAAKGDTWAINELPSSARSSAATRADIRAAVLGLYDGPANSPKMKGTVFVVGMGSTLTDFNVYKPNLESWLQDDAFWKQMAMHVQFWGQESYTIPTTVCVGAATVAQRSTFTNQYIEHFPTLADAGGSRSATARAFFAQAYVPLINAAYKAPAYSTSALTLAQMEQLVSSQIYAARSWGESHAYVQGRVGMGWSWEHASVPASDIGALSQRIAAALQAAYDPIQGAAAGACSPTHAYTWCACNVAGSSFNPGWSTFSHW